VPQTPRLPKAEWVVGEAARIRLVELLASAALWSPGLPLELDAYCTKQARFSAPSWQLSHGHYEESLSDTEWSGHELVVPVVKVLVEPKHQRMSRNSQVDCPTLGTRCVRLPKASQGRYLSIQKYIPERRISECLYGPNFQAGKCKFSLIIQLGDSQDFSPGCFSSSFSILPSTFFK
jgi:hypothetical protein